MDRIRRPYLTVAALIIWIALIVQLHLSVARAEVNGVVAYDAVLHFFISFTILANILAGAAFWVASLNGRETPHPDAMAAVAMYVTIVFAIYLGEFHGALESSSSKLRMFADAVLHDIGPVLFVLYWLIYVPRGTLRWRAPFVWLIFPLVYLGLSLIYGSVSGYYPYPWIDAAALGYSKVFVNAGELTAIMLLVGFAVVAIDRIFTRRGIET